MSEQTVDMRKPPRRDRRTVGERAGDDWRGVAARTRVRDTRSRGGFSPIMLLGVLCFALVIGALGGLAYLSGFGRRAPDFASAAQGQAIAAGPVAPQLATGAVQAVPVMAVPGAAGIAAQTTGNPPPPGAGASDADRRDFNAFLAAGGDFAAPLDDAGRDALFRKFLAWRDAQSHASSALPANGPAASPSAPPLDQKAGLVLSPANVATTPVLDSPPSGAAEPQHAANPTATSNTAFTASGDAAGWPRVDPMRRPLMLAPQRTPYVPARPAPATAMWAPNG